MLGQAGAQEARNRSACAAVANNNPGETMNVATVNEAAEVQKGHFDPYQLDPAHVLEPPTRMGQILKKIGPGIILSASIVGSGELIATTTLGAEVGYTVMWLIIFSCLIKALVQSFLGRYTISRGETGLEAFNRIPGKIGKVNWVVWAWAVMVLITLFQICAMFIGVSQAMKLVTGIEVVWWVLAFFVLTLVLLLGGAYHRIERLAMVKVGPVYPDYPALRGRAHAYAAVLLLG